MMAVAVKESHSRCTSSGPPRPWQTEFLIVQERLLREHLHLLRVFIGRSLTVANLKPLKFEGHPTRSNTGNTEKMHLSTFILIISTFPGEYYRSCRENFA